MTSDNRQDYFSFPPDSLQQSSCAFCQHKHAGAATCEAFPDGIPDDILLMKNDHHEPVEGDHGIQFAPREWRQSNKQVKEGE